jgi:hypothetical protein
MIIITSFVIKAWNIMDIQYLTLVMEVKVKRKLLGFMSMKDFTLLTVRVLKTRIKPKNIPTRLQSITFNKMPNVAL